MGVELNASFSVNSKIFKLFQLIQASFTQKVALLNLTFIDSSSCEILLTIYTNKSESEEPTHIEF